MQPIGLTVKAWRALMSVASRDEQHPRKLNRVLLWPDRIVATDAHRLLHIPMPPDPRRRASFDAVAAWPFFERAGGERLCTATLDGGQLRFTFDRVHVSLAVPSGDPDDVIPIAAVERIASLPREPATAMLLDPKYVEGLAAVYAAFGPPVLSSGGGVRIFAADGTATIFTFRNDAQPTPERECAYVIMRLLERGEPRPDRFPVAH